VDQQQKAGQMISEDRYEAWKDGTPRGARDWDAQELAGLAAHIRAQRGNQSVTQRRLAEQAGITQGHLSRIERGLCRPDAATLGKLADALGTSPARLLALAGQVASDYDSRGILRQYRTARSMSQSELAARMGTAESCIGMWETSRRPPLARRRQLVAVLGIPPALLGLTRPPAPGSGPEAPNYLSQPEPQTESP
jgi:transcriptional regulator with XRE-family HTH domain